MLLFADPDGLFVNVAQYLDNQLVLGVNPDPSSIAGVLMLFKPEEVRKVLETVGTERQRVELLPFVKGETDLKQVIWGINDLFVGRADQVSARYRIGTFRSARKSVLKRRTHLDGRRQQCLAQIND